MLLVDGHNLIGRTPGLSLGREEEAREAVLRRIGAAKGSGGERVVVVFDGNRPAAGLESFGGVRVVYSPAGRTADDEILRRARRGNPRAATVVTSDRGLAAKALALGSRVESCEAFWQRLIRHRRPIAPEKPEGGPEEVAEWLAEFQRRGRDGHKI